MAALGSKIASVIAMRNTRDRRRGTMDINEPKIGREEILILVDDDFNSRNVCIVTGAGLEWRQRPLRRGNNGDRRSNINGQGKGAADGRWGKWFIRPILPK
jgi:hypothetical protein